VAVIALGLGLLWLAQLGEPAQDMPAPREMPPVSESEALDALQREIARVGPAGRPEPDDRLERARAWVTANRPAGWPYAELEAYSLAQYQARLDGIEPTVADLIEQTRGDDIQLRAIDADGDGSISEEELLAFAAYVAEYSFPKNPHPYIVALLDADGDGMLSAQEQAPASQLRLNEIGMRAMADRARLDAWDTDGDGLLSDEERDSGRARLVAHTLVNLDGSVDWLETPAGQTAEQQAEVFAKIAAERAQGEYWAGVAEAQRDNWLRQNLSRPTIEAILGNALPGPDEGAASQLPAQPDPREYGAEGGRFTDDNQLQRYMAAVQRWEVVNQNTSVLIGAERARAALERAGAEFDADGDGRLSDGEWVARRDALGEATARRLFLLHYDLDGSGRVETGELVSYLEWYRAGSMRADINYDGVLDGRDLESMAGRYQSQGG
jgi:Ca2+-binding EF-hand superfamily protein